MLVLLRGGLIHAESCLRNWTSECRVMVLVGLYWRCEEIGERPEKWRHFVASCSVSLSNLAPIISRDLSLYNKHQSATGFQTLSLYAEGQAERLHPPLLYEWG